MTDDSLLLAIAGCEIVFFLAMALVAMRLRREQKKLKQDLETMAALLERSNGDVAGLCSAAVSVDKRLAANELRLNGVIENISVSQIQPQPSDDEEYEEVQARGYELAIEKIRRGADIEELVKSCGLTRDEAVLLMRLHGSR